MRNKLRAIKFIAEELNISVLLLLQLDSLLKTQEDKRPKLSDLKRLGSIDQEADTVIFIYRDKEIIIAKHAFGPMRVIKMEFLSEYFKFKKVEL